MTPTRCDPRPGGRGSSAELSRAAQEWRDTFDAIESPIVILDAGARITRLNRAAQRLAARPFEALVGQPLSALAARQPWREVQRGFEAVRAGEGCEPARVVDEQGRAWEMVANSVAHAPDEVPRVIVMLREVTTAVRLEASLRRAEAMSAIGSIVAAVSHEVRNPLFAISALVDAIEAHPEASGGLERYLGALRGELERLSWLMRDLLEYARPAAQEIVSAGLAELVEGAVTLCARAAGAAKVAVSTRLPEGGAALRLDRGRVIQALANLVENAIQHSPPGAAVCVEAWRREEGGRAWVEVAVVDRGPGFREADLPRVFEPFFTGRRGGTGLGLCIAQRIAEGHGGCLTAGNRPDGGAIVSMRLPVAGCDALRAGA